MNIAMLSYHTSPLAALGGKHSGGMNVYVRALSIELGRRGHVVDIFTRGERQEEQVISPGVRLISIPAGPSRELAINELPAHIPEFVSNVIEFAHDQKREYDIIHAHYWISGLAGIQLKNAWGAPMVLMFHTLGLVKNRITALGASESDVRIRAERQAMAAADRVVAATPAERYDLQWLYELRSDRVVVIPPGVDLQLFHPTAKEEARHALSLPLNEHLLLYVGRIEALKGIDTLIRGVALLGHEVGGKRLRIQIIGGDIEERFEALGSEMEKLRQLTTDLGVQEQIKFLGSRSQAQLPTYYAAADIVVMPSYSESFGMVALEAMACGRPVIASQVGGLAFLVKDGETGFLVQEGNVQQLANRLAELLQDPKLLQQMGQVARREAENYSWQVTTTAIESVYADLLGKNT